VPTASSTTTVNVPLAAAVTAISAARAPDAVASSAALGLKSLMRGVKLPVCVISPTRTTMPSPALAEKVQESESPAGEIVPVNVSPEAIDPWAPATEGQNIASSCTAITTNISLILVFSISIPLLPVTDTERRFDRANASIRALVVAVNGRAAIVSAKS